MSDKESVPSKDDMAIQRVDAHPTDGLMPVSLADKMLLAGVVLRSGLAPKSLDTKEKVAVALLYGHELGIGPMASLSNIISINGRPTLSADLMLALCRKHPEFAGVSIDANPKGCTVILKRRTPTGAIDEFRSAFTEDDAKRAGLLGKQGPWTQYPARMYRARALAFACRDGFSDVLAGLLAKEEAIDIGPEPEEPRNVTSVDLPAARAEVLKVMESPVFSAEQRQQAAEIVGTITTTETLAVLKAKLEKERDLKTPIPVPPKNEPPTMTATQILQKRAQMQEAPKPPAITVEEPAKVDAEGQQEIF